ncbi:hypothetical protein BHM03_00015101, partial [Ensete ventricosum]
IGEKTHRCSPTPDHPGRMAVTTTKLDTGESLHSTFASRYVRASLPRFMSPSFGYKLLFLLFVIFRNKCVKETVGITHHSIPKDAAYQIINDELMLDGNPRLNLASFVTTWMEPECDRLIMAAVNKNYVDMDEYPVTTELQVRQRFAL